MRNFYHIFVGFTIMYMIGCLTGFATYTLQGKIIGVPLLSAFLGLVFGFVWEWLQIYFTITYKDDLKDVLRTAIGFFIGGIVSLFFVNQILMFAVCILSGLLLANEVRYYIQKK